jgi:hypothetical protein
MALSMLSKLWRQSCTRSTASAAHPESDAEEDATALAATARPCSFTPARAGTRHGIPISSER